jgi:hypothetical protein
MRDGRLLAEGKPEDLMAQYGKRTLEETFLALCTGCAAHAAAHHAPRCGR